MYRRFLVATLIIAVSAVVSLGVPLGLAVTHLIRSEVVRSSDELAGTIAAAVDARLRANEPVTADAFGDYGPDGQVVEIVPPGQSTITIGDANRTDLLWSRQISSELGAQVRVGVGEPSTRDRTNRAWYLVAALAAIGVSLALALAAGLARHTSRRFASVAAAAHRLGDGDFSARSPADSGIDELDAIADALNRSAERIAELVAAERRFTLDASHQLRTPLTALTIRLEEIAATDTLDAARHEATAAIRHADRLLESITQLLEISRRHRDDTRTGPVDLGTLTHDHVRLFEPAMRRAHRKITIDTLGDTTVACSNAAVGQALNVLLDNALTHGTGHVAVAVEDVGTGVRIRVADQGSRSTNTTADALGLPLARTLIDAEGGHLSLLAASHTTYEIVIPRRNPSIQTVP